MASEADAHAAKRSRRPVSTDSMVVQVRKAIGYEVNLESDRPRYRKLALAALKSLARRTEARVDAAYEALWFDAFWAVNSRADFKKAVQAMIRAAMER